MGVIVVAFTIRWQFPVHVGESEHLSEAIAGPADALRHLKTLQYRSGPAYRRALDLCQHALLNGVHPEMARSPFVAACADDSARRMEED